MFVYYYDEMVIEIGKGGVRGSVVERGVVIGEMDIVFIIIFFVIIICYY